MSRFIFFSFLMAIRLLPQPSTMTDDFVTVSQYHPLSARLYSLPVEESSLPGSGDTGLKESLAGMKLQKGMG
ncbi:MAG: hypothetical protein C4530_08870 [Desulfobacteraceae bacterium]|nr:MAG: hypothetical protein C4530_08870 [Desulfobacteraceae bacterium]